VIVLGYKSAFLAQSLTDQTLFITCEMAMFEVWTSLIVFETLDLQKSQLLEAWYWLNIYRLEEIKAISRTL